MATMQPDSGPRPSDPAFDELKAFVVNATGNFRLSTNDGPFLEKARSRLTQNGVGSFADYLVLLKHGEPGRRELDSLIAELTVGETFFFRHPDHFAALREVVLPACLKRNEQSRQLRIWSAGCANGAEAYSIAILVHEVLGDALKDWNVTIVGSDINRGFLAEAEAGIYSAWTLRGVPPEQLPAYFERDGSSWSLLDKYRGNVHFVHHNLINDEIQSIHRSILAFDVIFCRNVMIYFEGAVNLRLAERLNQVLGEDGWLFVGSTDFNPHLDAVFEMQRQSGAIVYRKRRPVLKSAKAVPATTLRPTEQTARPRNGSAPASKPGGRRRASRVEAGRGPATEAGATAPAPAGDIGRIVELADRGDWDNATRQCVAILAADSLNAPAHYYHALILQSTGAAAEAEQALRRAIYLDPGFALAHYQLGLARKDAHDLAGSARAFRNALDALGNTADDQPISPCGLIAAADIRGLASQQLVLLSRPS
jgi:chemotaxis protein methyltransferase CheR